MDWVITLLLTDGPHPSREITNGVWFFLNLYVLFYLSRLVWYTMRRSARPIWRQPDYVKLAWGMNLILIGSTIRAGWVWLLLIAEENRWYKLHLAVYETGLLRYVAIGFAMWGAICIAKLFQSKQRTHGRQALHVAFVVLAAFLIPILVHLLTY